MTHTQLCTCIYNFDVKVISDFFQNWRLLLSPTIYCCFALVVFIRVVKIDEGEAVVVIVEMLILGGVELVVLVV